MAEWVVSKCKNKDINKSDRILARNICNLILREVIWTILENREKEQSLQRKRSALIASLTSSYIILPRYFSSNIGVQANILFDSSYMFCERLSVEHSVSNINFIIEIAFPVFNQITLGSAITGVLATAKLFCVKTAQNNLIHLLKAVSM